jgi:hypothetical protein
MNKSIPGSVGQFLSLPFMLKRVEDQRFQIFWSRLKLEKGDAKFPVKINILQPKCSRIFGR